MPAGQVALWRARSFLLGCIQTVKNIMETEENNLLAFISGCLNNIFVLQRHNGFSGSLENGEV